MVEQAEKILKLKRLGLTFLQTLVNIDNIVDSVKGRCRFRGEQVGVKYAEAFEIVKEIKL